MTHSLTVLASGAALALALGAARRQDAPPAAVAPAAATPARVVLITLDTVRADLFGCYGDGRGLTPHLDRLAQEGVRFARAVAPMPETLPSHAALLTGRSPLSHGTTSNYLTLAADATTLAELLADAGVATGAFMNVMPFEAQQVTQGFATCFTDPGALAAEVAPRWLAWHDALPAQQPALAWLHYYVAHAPYEPPPEWAARFVSGTYSGGLDFSPATILRQNQAPRETPADWLAALEERYAAELALVDARVGEVVEALRSRGQLDSTLLVCVADHGESFRPGTLALHSLSTRQQTMHVPLIVRGPGVPAGRVVAPWVQMTDLFATLLEPFSAAPPDGVECRSLWPLLRGDDVEWEDVAFGSLPVPIENHAAGKLPDVLVAWSGRFKLQVVDVNGSPRGVLRDLEADPLEEADCSAQHPQVVAGLHRRLAQWVKEQRAQRLSPSAASDDVRKHLEALGYTGD